MAAKVLDPEQGRIMSSRLGRQTSRHLLVFGAVSLAPLILAIFLILGRSVAKAQTASVALQSKGVSASGTAAVGTMSDLMISMVYPAANNLLLFVYRGGPQDDKDWAAIQRNAVLLAESGNALIRRGPAGDESNWAKNARILVDVGAAAYKAARTKDGNALMALDQPLNAACTACHKQYRPNIAGPAERQGPSHLPAQ